MAFPDPNVFKNQLKQNRQQSATKTAASNAVAPATGGFATLAKKVVGGITGMENRTTSMGKRATASLSSTLVGSLCKLVGKDPREFMNEIGSQFNQGGANNPPQGPMFM